DALELADLFILKKYRRLGIGRALAERTLCQGERAWLVRFYRQDELAAAFCQRVLGELPRAGQQLAPDDDPQLLSYLAASATPCPRQPLPQPQHCPAARLSWRASSSLRPTRACFSTPSAASSSGSMPSSTRQMRLSSASYSSARRANCWSSWRRRCNSARS